MGQTSNPSETDENEMLSEKDVSQYLSLHSYSAKPPMSPRPSTKVKSPKKPKEILPKTIPDKMNDNELASYVTIPDFENDVVYGTYDENTNLITIIVEDEDCISEIVDNEVVIEENNGLCVPKIEIGSTSPCSDYGYESYGSPGENIDVWDTSVSELFPNLIL